MTRNVHLQAFLSHVAETIEEHLPPENSEETMRVLSEGSDHPYTCRCTTCLAWWSLVGPEQDEGEPVSYGPFTAKEIAAYRKTQS